MTDTQPLFMRLPRAAAEQLDQAARDHGMSRREIVTRLITGDDLVVGQHDFRPTEPPAVLTPADAAALLRVGEDVLVGLAESGEIPARRLGDEWRFSREALLAWLGGDDAA
jgi:excisionase family DNA binding protein